MSSVKTEVGETTDFFRELLHHTEYGRPIFSVSTELGK